MISVSKKNYINEGNKALLRLIPDKMSSVLDVGCGAGGNASYFFEKGIVVDGITLSEIEAENAQKFMRQVIIFNLENGLPSEIMKNKYDVVICSHVLEHICFPETLLANIREVLGKDGILVVALPNLMHYKNRWELIKGNFKQEDSGIWDYTHFRWYTFFTAQTMLRHCGFKILKAEVEVALPFGRLTNKSPNFIKKIFKRISPSLFGGQLLYMAVRS